MTEFFEKIARAVELAIVNRHSKPFPSTVVTGDDALTIAFDVMNGELAAGRVKTQRDADAVARASLKTSNKVLAIQYGGTTISLLQKELPLAVVAFGKPSGYPRFEHTLAMFVETPSHQMAWALLAHVMEAEEAAELRFGRTGRDWENLSATEQQARADLVRYKEFLLLVAQEAIDTRSLRGG